jgi:hypothetical protein
MFVVSLHQTDAVLRIALSHPRASNDRIEPLRNSQTRSVVTGPVNAKPARKLFERFVELPGGAG